MCQPSTSPLGEPFQGGYDAGVDGGVGFPPALEPVLSKAPFPMRRSHLRQSPGALQDRGRCHCGAGRYITLLHPCWNTSGSW